MRSLNWVGLAMVLAVMGCSSAVERAAEAAARAYAAVPRHSGSTAALCEARGPGGCVE